MTVLTILLLACITFGTRYLFLEGRLPVRLGSNIKQFLSYSGPAVLTAITMPILFVHKQQLDTAVSNSICARFIFPSASFCFLRANSTSSLLLELLPNFDEADDNLNS